MKAFEYIAADPSGQAVAGTAWAEDELDLDATLEERGLVLTRARTVEGEGHRRALRMGSADLIHLTAQLATMTSAGVPLMEGLEGIRARSSRPVTRRLLAEMISALRSGGSLSSVMAAYPRTFPSVYRAGVVAGEASGALDTILRRLAGHLDWARSLRATTMQALIYPAILALALLGLIGILLFFLLPRIVGLFPGGVQDLPAQTRLVLSLSGFLREHVLLLGGLASAAFAGACALLRTETGRLHASRWLVSMPIVGPVARDIATCRFAGTAAILQGAGCNAFTVLDVATQAAGNPHMAAAFRRASERVKRGARLSEALENEPAIDRLLVQLVEVGERSGKLDECFEQVARHHDQELPRTVKRMLGLLEPGLLLVAGVVVAFLLLAALLPMFQLMETLR